MVVMLISNLTSNSVTKESSCLPAAKKCEVLKTSLKFEAT